jgi:hypothetical protein
MPIRDQRLLALYAEDVFSCELCDILHCCQRGSGDVHHITGGPQRHDVLTNVVMLCRSAHRHHPRANSVPVVQTAEGAVGLGVFRLAASVPVGVVRVPMGGASRAWAGALHGARRDASGGAMLAATRR